MQDEEWDDDDPLGGGSNMGEFDYLSCKSINPGLDSWLIRFGSMA